MIFFQAVVATAVNNSKYSKPVVVETGGYVTEGYVTEGYIKI